MKDKSNYLRMTAAAATILLLILLLHSLLPLPELAI